MKVLISYTLNSGKNLYRHPDFESTIIVEGTSLKKDILVVDKFIILLFYKPFGTCIKCLIFIE
jgi:hypothetical protein